MLEDQSPKSQGSKTLQQAETVFPCRLGDMVLWKHCTEKSSLGRRVLRHSAPTNRAHQLVLDRSPLGGRIKEEASQGSWGLQLPSQSESFKVHFFTVCGLWAHCRRAFRNPSPLQNVDVINRVVVKHWLWRGKTGHFSRMEKIWENQEGWNIFT